MFPGSCEARSNYNNPRKAGTIWRLVQLTKASLRMVKYYLAVGHHVVKPYSVKPCLPQGSEDVKKER